MIIEILEFGKLQGTKYSLEYGLIAQLDNHGMATNLTSLDTVHKKDYIIHVPHIIDPNIWKTLVNLTSMISKT